MGLSEGKIFDFRLRRCLNPHDGSQVCGLRARCYPPHPLPLMPGPSARPATPPSAPTWTCNFSGVRGSHQPSRHCAFPPEEPPPRDQASWPSSHGAFHGGPTGLTHAHTRVGHPLNAKVRRRSFYRTDTFGDPGNGGTHPGAFRLSRISATDREFSPTVREGSFTPVAETGSPGCPGPSLSKGEWCRTPEPQ